MKINEVCTTFTSAAMLDVDRNICGCNMTDFLEDAVGIEKSLVGRKRKFFNLSLSYIRTTSLKVIIETVY